MKLIIFGASGRTGRELIRQALAQNHSVTAFVRIASDFEVQESRLTILRGEVTEPEDVAHAIEGQEAVINALGPRTLINRIPALTAATRNIVHAMETSGPRRLIYLSALGVGDSEADQNLVFRLLIRPILLGRDYADHEENEQVIRRSNLEWIILRPARLVDRPRTGQYQVDLRLSATFPFGKIGRADVADFILKQLGDTPYLRKSPGLLAFKGL